MNQSNQETYDELKQQLNNAYVKVHDVNVENERLVRELDALKEYRKGFASDLKETNKQLERSGQELADDLRALKQQNSELMNEIYTLKQQSKKQSGISLLNMTEYDKRMAFQELEPLFGNNVSAKI
ncbi:MAG TPA: hypothetical protein ENK71_01160, partial [Epsilonproteobacteria bacterium]|nr:hypothetical protein [Campylobacterota bacterium]